MHVFLDLKFYDIPETVRRAVAQVAQTGVRFLTVHAVPSVMRAAVEGKGASEPEAARRHRAHQLRPGGPRETSATRAPSRNWWRRARGRRWRRGVDGIVCSPLEVAAVRQIAGPEAVLVTPGVRSAGSAKGDQKRVATPAEAMRDGADYLVIGRQITRAADPAAEASRVLEEIATAWAARSI